MRRQVVMGIALSLSILVAGPAAAQTAPVLVSPLQGGHYYPSLMNLRDYTTPAAGLYVLWYNAYGWSDSFYDQHGNKFASVNLSQLNPRLPDLNVNVNQGSFMSTPTLVWALDKLLPFGIRYFALLSLPFVSGSGSGILEGGGIVVPPGTTTSANYSATGFGDLALVPVGLSMSTPKLDLTFTWMVYAPTGKWEVGGTDNTGLGFWTNQLQLFGYFFPQAGRKTAIQLGLTYEFNTDLKGQPVKPGNRFTIQYGVDHYFTEALLLGLQGGNNWQVTNDTGSGVYWDPDVHDSTNFWGVSAGYWVWQDRLMVNTKYVMNYAPRQHFGNSAVYLNLIFATKLLDGQ